MLPRQNMTPMKTIGSTDKMRILFLSALLFCACSLSGAQTLIQNGKSSFVIVHAGQRSQYSANFLKKMLKYATGADLRVIAEKQYTPGTPAIFIGATQAAKERKLIPSQYAPWEHRIDIEKGKVFLTGSDSPGTKVGRAEFESGMLKAVITFLERFCDSCFFAPGALRQYIAKQKEIRLPDRFSLRKKPSIVYCMSRSKQMEYDLATNAFYAHTFYSSLGGHSYPQAVPMKKYLKSHPEYFAQRNGKPNPTRFNHLCISNKTVQDLLYKNLLEQADSGHNMVQLGQTDAYQPCHCKGCIRLYGIVPKGKPGDKDFNKDPAWKEKLWILHRDLAQRFLKERPGKLVAIMAYGPTNVPPATFKEFPGNVWIELAPFNAEVMKRWQGYKVKAFSAYLYFWGTYNAEGFTPNQNFKALQVEAAGYRKHNIRGLYRCGFGELPGLAGPAYYIWGKLLDDPDADIDAMLKRYCRFAFPRANAEMEEFYRYLDSRLQLQLHNMPATDWNSISLLTGSDKSWKPLELFKLRYPESVLNKLDSLLKKAESKNKGQLIKIARVEFDYLCHTARAAQAVLKFRKDTSDANWRDALKALETRERFIKSLPTLKGSVFMHGRYLFGLVDHPKLMMGGRLSATLYAPFNWGTEKLRKYNIKISGRKIKAGSPEWQYLVPHHRWVEVDEKLRPTTVKFRCERTADGVKFIVVAANVKKELRKQYYARIFLGPEKKKLQWFPARFNNTGTTWYKLALTNEENGNAGAKYTHCRGRAGITRSPAPGVKLAPGEISVEITIPFALFGCTPKAGEEWLLNVAGGLRGCDLIWEFNMNQTHYRHTTINNGKIIF